MQTVLPVLSLEYWCVSILSGLLWWKNKSRCSAVPVGRFQSFIQPPTTISCKTYLNIPSCAQWCIGSFFYSSLSESWGCIDLELKDRKPCCLFCSPPNECDVLLNVHFKLNDGSPIALRDRQYKCFCPFLLTVPAFKCPEKTVIVVACCSFSVIHPKLFFPSLSLVLQLVESWAATFPPRRRIGLAKDVGWVGGQTEVVGWDL